MLQQRHREMLFENTTGYSRMNIRSDTKLICVPNLHRCRIFPKVILTIRHLSLSTRVSHYFLENRIKVFRMIFSFNKNNLDITKVTSVFFCSIRYVERYIHFDPQRAQTATLRVYFPVCNTH